MLMFNQELPNDVTTSIQDLTNDATTSIQDLDNVVTTSNPSGATGYLDYTSSFTSRQNAVRYDRINHWIEAC
uniref:Uncharacterized protein n=1 Tax=Acrobeloides nanus TaxID=290746 RepID=A0A914DLK8_9BILA